MPRIGIVGLGDIAASHLTALASFDGVDVAGGVDREPGKRLQFRGQPRPVYRSTEELLRLALDAVVVATPTPSHAEVVAELLDRGSPSAILVEKPLAATLSEWRSVDDRACAGTVAVSTLFHAAFAPEVLWAAGRVPSLRQEHGPVRYVESTFCDPYPAEDRHARSSYVSSWVDSGINALSVLARLVRLEGLTSLETDDPARDVWTARLAVSSSGQTGQGVLRTSWDEPSATKRTRLTFADSAVLTLDHRAMAAELETQGARSAVYESGSSLLRLTQHYMNMWRAWLAHRRFDGLPDALLHRLLLSPPTTAPSR